MNFERRQTKIVSDHGMEWKSQKDFARVIVEK